MSSFTVLNVADPQKVGSAIRAALERKESTRPGHWAISDSEFLLVAEEGKIADHSKWFVERGGMRLQVMVWADDVRWRYDNGARRPIPPVIIGSAHAAPLIKATGLDGYTVTDDVAGALSGVVKEGRQCTLFIHGPHYGTLLQQNPHRQEVSLVTW